MTVKDLHSQNQEELIEYAKALGLDSQGPKKVVFDRIVMFLKEKGEYQPPSDKRKKRSKKKKSIRLPDALDAADTTEPQEVEVEVVQEEPLFKNQKDFQEILNRFQENTQRGLEREEQDDMDLDEDDEEANLPDREELAKSKKKLAKLNRMTVAELKQMVKKPEVVEWIDVTGSDPLLLVQLKSTRNTAPVPIHWAQKRKYLQGKRGMEKPPFELPEYIKATGIMQMRQAHQGAQSMTGKLRERHHPKLGRLDIDYEKLHDAFFKYQTKPAFSCHGDVYYEGKEFETRLRMRRPGVISDELKDALNIPPGAPPPWLINMQRYGPPPSYPQLKIPGLNAPIPQGAQWGFHPGGWGKPPTDENNQPLYGDVFGTTVIVPAQFVAKEEKQWWGELEEEEEEVEQEEEEIEEQEESSDEDMDQGSDEEIVELSGMETPSGTESVIPQGMETPQIIQYLALTRNEPKSLYKVLPQQQTSISGFMGSSHAYTVESKDVALDPEELEHLDQETLKRKYEETTKVTRKRHEDVSDLVDEHAKMQAQKRVKKDTKKHKDFKF